MPPDDQPPASSVLRTAPAPAPTQPWVTLEGTNGVGKTYLARHALQHLGARCVPLIELPDQAPALLPGQVIGALRATGDLFLRTGHPRTETLLLAALQVHRHETTKIGPGQVVLEDRGPYSMAVYQAAILSVDAPLDEAFAVAGRILELLAPWRPLPTATLLLVDDPDHCLGRFEQRTGRQASPSEVALMQRVTSLYRLFAATSPQPFEILDRTHLDADACVRRIVAACDQAAAPSQGPR
jgi:dTMP kinase